jgi:predicted transcriptional regulator
MALSKLFDLKASVVPTEQVTIRLDVDLLAQADELAQEIGITRTEVIREAFRDGMARTWSDWETAKLSAKTGGSLAPKKVAKK